MKRLAILCALACALVACDDNNKLAMIDDTEITSPTDTIDPNTPTASFYVGIKSFRPLPQEYASLMEDDLISPKYGKIWLVDNETDIEAHDGNPFSSFKYAVPHDSNYFDNPKDMLNLFDNGTFRAIQTIEGAKGSMVNVPYGRYGIVGCMGVPHAGSIKSYMVSFAHIIIDDKRNGDSVPPR